MAWSNRLNEPRLEGEYDQQCSKDGQDWPCGQEAKRQLEAMVSGQQLECRGVGKDTYGRILSLCSAVGVELNHSQVEQGWAVAFREFSGAYLGAELQANTNRECAAQRISCPTP